MEIDDKELDPLLEEGKLLEGLEDAPEEVRERIKTTVSTLNAKRKHWHEKAIDPETGKPYKDILAEAKKSVPPPPPPPKPKEEKSGASEAERDFLLYNPNLVNELGKEGVDEVFAYARGRGISPQDAINSEGGKILLEGLRQKKRAEVNTPPPSNRAPGGTAPKPFSSLSQEEKKKGYSAKVGELIDKGRSGK